MRQQRTIHIIILLAMLMMGVGEVCAQSASVWDGTAPATTWDAANAATAGITGTGTEADPYVIHDAKGFVYFWWAANNGSLNSSTQYWKLDTDIDLDNHTWPYVNLNKTFKGKFDGQNHTIRHMLLEPATGNYNYGLFCMIEGQAANNRAEVKNLVIDSATIAPSADFGKTTSVGVLVGKANKYADISNIKVTHSNIVYANNITDANYVGGIAGQTNTDTKLTNCSVDSLGVTTSGTTTNAYFGGLIGYIGSQTSVTGCSTNKVIITYNAIANASRISGFIAYAKGSATVPVTISGNTVTNTTIHLKQGINNGSYIGAFLGQTANNVQVAKNNKVVSPSVTIDGTIKAASYIGGVVGDFAGAASNPLTTIDSLTVTSPLVTINKDSVANPYIGAVFGRISTYSAVKNVTVSKPTLTYKATDNPNFTLNLGSFAGQIAGNATQEVAVTDIQITDTARVIVGIGSSNISNVRAGLVGIVSNNALLRNWRVANTVVLMKGNLTAASSYVGGIVAYASTAAAQPVTLRDIRITNRDSVVVSGNVDITSYVGGAVGYRYAQTPATFAPFYADSISVSGLDIAFGGNFTNTLYVGGVAGCVTAVAATDRLSRCIASGKIHSVGAHTFAQDKTYAFGGIVGFTAQGTTYFSEINNSISEVDFDLSSLSPATKSGNLYNLNKSILVVGGVIGRINSTSRLPYRLYYSGKINAPFAAVGPIVGVFAVNTGTGAYIYHDYSGMNVQALNLDEWKKANEWYYNGYKLGLSDAVLTQSARTKNFTAAPETINGVKYLNITGSTFKQSNQINQIDVLSRTVLAYTQNNKDQDFGIYPQWTTNSTTYPAYYMYYMQGVNRGTYLADSKVAATKENFLSNTVNLTLTDDNANYTLAANRGFVPHTLRVTANETVTYKWYVDDVLQSTTGNTLVLTPAVESNAIRVDAIKGGVCVAQAYYWLRAVLRVTDPSASTYGTSTNPYLIGTAKELQLLSHLSAIPNNLYWEKNYIVSSHYNRAYYELDADIDLSGVADFKPIAFPKSTNTDGTLGGYSQSFVFDGVFDGKMHTISGLKETWFAGSLNTNNQNVAWGLFAFVGNSKANTKVGESSNSNAVIKNLIIVNATLTHDQNNTSFYYNNGNSGNGNYCHVGVLAGIVSSNTTIQNIEIRNSKITDEGSYPYSLATKGLHVGGAIGSLQNAFNDASSVPANTQIQHIAAQVDITLTQPTFVNSSAGDQLGQFNIGGIIGRYIATSATQVQMQTVMPAYTFYSGNITAPKAWISPVLGALRYKDQQNLGFSTFSKQWEGNNNTAATQIAIANAQYYNFRISSIPITELYPTNICGNGARTIGLHTDAAEAVATYDAKNYQGVNYAAHHVDAVGVSLQPLNENAYDNIYWHWENGFPHMRAGDIYIGAYLTRSDYTLTAQMSSGTVSAYRWQISFDGENWQDIAGATTATYTASPSNKTKLVAAIVTSEGTDYRTQIEAIRPVTGLYNPSVVKTGESSTGYTFTIDWGANVPAGTLAATYEWYQSDKTTPLVGKSGSSITMNQSELTAAGGYIWCAINMQEFGETLSNWMLVAGDLNVVYINGTGYTGNGAGVGNDANDGRSPQTPVKTIDKANSLLTTPADGGTWDNNIIVVMGALTTTGDFRSNGKNPATLTGRWNGVDYEGIIQIKQFKVGDEHNLNPVCNGKTGHSSYVLADTKFEYLTFKANSNGDGNNLLELHGNDVWFGKGLEMKNFKKLSDTHGNLDNAQNIPELTVVMTCSNPNEATLRKYTNRTEPQVITVESGHYGRFVGGRFTDGFFAKAENTAHSIQGSAEHPTWAVINVDIDKDNPNTDNYTCDINAVVAGLTDGTMFGDMEINLHGGKISYVVGANQGNCVVNGDKTFTPEGGVSGNYGQWPNSSFFGRTVINIDEQDGLKPLEVQSIYAGGLGRSADPSKAPTVVDMYVYGRTAINVKRGTINGELYGGGSGGVLGKNPWDAHIPYATTAADDANTAVMNGVQYGTWGAKQPGDALATVTLHNADGQGGYTTEMLRLDSTSTTISISGGTVNGSVYGGGYGYVSNMPEVITLQGVGSVFGNSILNITGGTINGSVYGGSKGNNKYYGSINKYGQTITHIAELNGNVCVNISGTQENYPTITGNIYGGGAGIESNGGEEYRRIATTGNTDLGEEYKTEITVTIDLPEEYVFPGNIYGGGEMGTVDGNTKVIIKSGTFNGSVFGGGKGELGHPKKAKVTGTTTVQIGEEYRAVSMVNAQSVTIRGNIYGGGEMAKVDGSTDVTIHAGQLGGDIFGGGEGAVNPDGSVRASADISGNTQVTVNGGKFLAEQYTAADAMENPEHADGMLKRNYNVYGGGNLACVVGTLDGEEQLVENTGSTSVVLNAAMLPESFFAASGPAPEGSSQYRRWGETYAQTHTNKAIQGSVFGAGYGKNTQVLGNTAVDIHIGEAETALADSTAIQNLFALAKRGADPTGETLASKFVITALGGGYDGTVGGNTTVTIEGSPMLQNVFGGGLGSVAGAEGDPASEVGTVYGSATVNILGGAIYGDVFGGGAGISGEVNVAGNDLPYYKAGWVRRETEVIIGKDDKSVKGINIFGNVYGGGDIANTGWYTEDVMPLETFSNSDMDLSNALVATSIHLNAGNVLGDVYGGGNGRASWYEDYTGPEFRTHRPDILGSMCGSTLVQIDGATVWGDIYGGGKTGRILTPAASRALNNDEVNEARTGEGETYVYIKSGKVGKSIYGGGLGDVANGGNVVTAADVLGNTIVFFENADLAFTEYWSNAAGRFLPQDNEDEKRGTATDVLHNLYGGGNLACTIGTANAGVLTYGGNTHVLMKGSPTVSDLDALKNIGYFQRASQDAGLPHFSAFGGGYGRAAVVSGNATLDVALENGSGFFDAIGGGLNGPIMGSTTVNINTNNKPIYSVYGGGYYAKVHQGTTVNITNADILESVYGGGALGDIGKTDDTSVRLNISGGTIAGDVYGANDVSGTVEGLVKLNITGGSIKGNVYGAGNGDHIGYYTPGLCKYDVGENDNYYVVLHREVGAPTGNTYKGRPQTPAGVEMTLAGTDAEHRVEVLGQVFGGGNSCTVGEWDADLLTTSYRGNPHETRDDPDYFLGGGKIDVTIGSHVKIGRSHKELIDDEDDEYLNADGENVSGLYMGCSGRHLATQETSMESNAYHHYYDAYTAKYWPGFAVYNDAGTELLSRAEGLRSFNAYMNNILVWSDSVKLTIANDAEDIWLANFVGGGFRGSMKAKTAEGRFAYTLPEGVTVGNAIVGGAYNTDVVYRIFETSDGHAYTTKGGHYKYLTEPGSLTQYDATTNPNGDYHHIEYAEDGTTPTGIVRFYYDGGMLAENGGNRIHKVHAADDYATAYFEPLTSGSGAENEATKAKLYTRNKDNAFLYLNLRCALEPEVLSNKAKAVAHSIHGGLVFGGCYMSGLVQGDSWIDYGAWLSPACANSDDDDMKHYFSKTNNMAVYDEAADLVNNNALNVFGAGFGENTHTAGDTYLYIKAVAQDAGGDGDMTGKFPYMFNAFGGSYAGHVEGNTNVYYASGKQGTLLGSLYGGGFLGDIDGNTFVELAEGFVTNVYGGSRQANIGGAAHVWAYDGKNRGISDANHLIICNLYGGNDIAGEIRGTMPAEFATTRWDALEGKGFNTYVEVSTDEGSANRGFPLIGSAYAGGNGEQWAEELGTAPNVGTALIEIDGGSTLRAFGGGNMATVTEETNIFTDAHSTNFANVTFSENQKNIMQNVFFHGVPTGYTWSGTTLTMDPEHVVNLYGGNNVAEMRIQPQWNLKTGKLGSVYAGGNLGNMTYYNADGLSASKGAINPTPKGLSIHVESDSIEIKELYGGCRLADVRATIYEDDGEGNITATYPEFGENDYGATVNVSGGRISNVYGGNDIAGHVYNGANVNICGAISGDVYGSGNGNYIYQYDASKTAPKAGDIDVRIKGDLNNGGYVYYAFRGTDSKADETAKIQAINAIRPNVDKAYLNVAGTESNLVYVTGNVYCGGNASTVSGAGSYTKFDIGSYCVLNGVYMGSNGEKLADASNIANLREVNGIALNTAAVLKEYMNAVAMEALPRDFSISNDITEAYIGTFCLGGNRGSMTTNQPVHMTIPASVTIFDKIVGGCNNAYLSAGGTTTGGFTTYNTDKSIPKITLDIYAKFMPRVMYVPEKDNKNFKNYKAQKFLYIPLSSATNTTTSLRLKKTCNVYGGCYTRGHVYGDVVINMYSDMLGAFLNTEEDLFYNTTGSHKTYTTALKQKMLENTIRYNETSNLPAFSIFGGGYGSSTVIYGNTHIRLLNNHNSLTPSPSPVGEGGSAAPRREAAEPAPLVHPSANAIYGGGEAGKMIGTATIHIADGTVYSNVVGGALAGNIYGNTEILVGYPGYWEVQKTGEYKLKRSNFTTEELNKKAGDNDPAVRQSIFLTKGDRINAAIYQAINDYGDTKQTAALTRVENKVSKNWDDIKINIKGGIYGGGYSRAAVEDGQTAMANTVFKFSSSYNLSTAHPEYWTKDATLSGKAISKSGEYVYGGNSTIWVQDAVNATNFDTFSEGVKKEHITISTETDSVAHTGAGGIFGDGHSSLVAAFRSASVDGYGYAEHPANAPKLLNTFQRFDILQIRDCSMKMYGQIDVATGQNDPTNYAVSRITELMLNSNINDSLTLLAPSELNARNVIDFYNPVHFLGSITSEVTFKPFAQGGTKYHDKDGVVAETPQSYYDYKSAQVAQNYDYASKNIHEADGCKEAFGARNVGTAKNMIRIDDPEGRGVHLKVVQENNYEINAQGVKEELSFYGPLSGVFEFALTHVNARGGGYVYSNNLHEQTIADSDAAHVGSTDTSKESFLQTSGNVFFVPVHIASINKDRSVYDDCYPIPYSEHDGQLDMAHYWFVEGDGPTWCSYPETPTIVDEEKKTITIETAEQLAWVYDYIDHGYDVAKESEEHANHDSYSAEHDKYPLNFKDWTIELGNDIDLGQLTILDQREVPMIWCPIADQKGTYFEGKFDGKGHKIDGMLLDVDFITTKSTYGNENYAEGYDHYFGLFAKTQGATIQNVELSDAQVMNVRGNENEKVHIGTLITQVTGTTVQDCSVQQMDTITTTQTNAVEAVAAFICHTDGAPSTIHRNFVSGQIYAESPAVTAPVSGFISTLGNGSSLEHCYSVVDVTAQQVAGLADTVKGDAELEHSYYAGKLTRTNVATPWGAILANADADHATVKHCYYDKTKNPDAKGYQGSDATVFSSKASGYTSWSTYGLTTEEMTSAKSGDVWRSCYEESHGHHAEDEAEEYRCDIDGAAGMTDAEESAWNKGIWTFYPGFYPFLNSQEIDCSALTSAFAMPSAESLHLTTKTDLADPEDGWYNIDKHFQLPTYGHMYWTVSNNTLLLDSVTAKDQMQTKAHLYMGGPDALTLNCDEYVRWMREIYVIREDINSPEDATWYKDSLSSQARVALGLQLRTDSLTMGMLRNKEVTNISKTKVDGKFVENGFDGDLHIWNREGSAGSVTNAKQYTVNGTITYYTGYTNPYLWHEVNVPFNVDHVTVYRSKTGQEYNITARNAELAENEDGGNFWLRSFNDEEEIMYGGSTFQQAWKDPVEGENYGHRPATLRFPKTMKVTENDEEKTYLSGDYWCYAQENRIDGTDYHNGGSEIRFYSTTGNTVYGTQDWEGHEDARGPEGGYSFRVFGNPTLGKIQLEGNYWILENEKRDTLGILDQKVKPEFGTDVAQWFSIQQDHEIPPFGIWVDGSDEFKQQALDNGNDAPLHITSLHEPGVNDMFGDKEATFTASGYQGLLGVFSYIDQVINIFDLTGQLMFSTPVRANTGFTLNLPSTLFLVSGTNSPLPVKVML